MAKKRNQAGKPDDAGNRLLAFDCIAQENRLIDQHRGELLTSLRTSAQRERLRSVDLRISACWFSAEGIQGMIDAMLEAIGDADGDAQEIRQSIINPYVIPVRMRLIGLRRALDEAQADCYTVPDEADLRMLLMLTPIRETDSTQAILQKSAENRRTINQRLQAHGYDVHYERLLNALLDVFDGEAAHAFDEGKLPDRAACANALCSLAEGVKQLRATYARP